MLNEKLMRWTEQHQLRARGQAGFRKDHRTTDQTFVVRTLIEKDVAKWGKVVRDAKVTLE